MNAEVNLKSSTFHTSHMCHVELCAYVSNAFVSTKQCEVAADLSVIANPTALLLNSV